MNIYSTRTPSTRRRGRPLGSKNKPKSIPYNRYVKYRGKFVKRNRKKKIPFAMYNSLYHEQVRTKLTYCQTVTISPATGSDVQQYLLNGLHISDHTDISNTHQAAFYSQWKDLYNNYRVIGARWSVTFSPSLSNADVTAQAVTIGAGDSVALMQPERNRHICFWECDRNPTVKFTQPGDRNFLRETGNRMQGVKWCTGPYSLNSKKTLTGKSNIKEYFHDKDLYDDSTAVGSNPTYPIYLTVGAMSEDGGATNDVRMNVTIHYIVEFTGQVDI